MLLVCGGQHMTANQDHDNKEGSPIVMYPPVLIVIEDDDQAPEKLKQYLSTVVDGFVVRLSDKDLIKIINSPAGQKALKREG